MEAPIGGVAPRPRKAAAPAAPPVPRGALRGDPARQPFSFRAPIRFFVDVERRCRGCGAAFVLAARDQKRWAETLGLKLDARASRCPGCRREYLRERGLAAALSDASRALAAAPLHPPAVLAYARAAAAFAARFGHAPLEAALAALSAFSTFSALGRQDPAAVEALYLEGLCQEARGRKGRASKALQRFLAAARGRTGLARQVSDARKRLAALPPAPRTS